MNSDIQKLKDINNGIWEVKQLYCNWMNGYTGGYKDYHYPARHLTNQELKFLYKCIRKHNLICRLYTAGNEGVGLEVCLPDPSYGMIIYPGIEHNIKDVISIIKV